MKKGGFKKTGFTKKSGFSKSGGLKKNNKSKRNRLKKTKRKKRRKNPRWNEIVKCDRAFSQLVRIQAADSNGVVKCYTCNYKGYWKNDKIECGHFKSRSHMTTRWDRNNARPQCSHCNQVLGGNLKEFTKRLLDDSGEEIIKYLDEKSRTIIKLTEEDVRGVRLKIERILRQVRKEKGI